MAKFVGFTPDAVANYFLDRGKESGKAITPMKLQKLMYFSHGWHLALHPEGDPLVSESAQAWDYGPVFPHTYFEFKDFGNRPIDRPAAAVALRDSGKLRILRPSIARQKKRVQDLEFSTAVLGRIWKVYSKYSAERLSVMTHEEGSPWWKVREEAKKIYAGMIPRGLNIPNPLIREWFRTRFQIQGE